MNIKANQKGIFISIEAIKNMNKDELLFSIFHEVEHLKQTRAEWLLKPKTSELNAQKGAMKESMKQGLSFNELIQMEIDYRFKKKYGVDLNKYIEFMKND